MSNIGLRLKAFPTLAIKIEHIAWKLKDVSLGSWVNFLDEISSAIESAKDQERARCLDIVRAARFGEVDQDFRAIHHMIESGRTVEEIKS